MIDRALPRGVRILIIGAYKATRLSDVKSKSKREQLGAETLRFAKILGRELVFEDDEVPNVIITGGRDHSTSIDRAIVAGAREVIDVANLQDRMITFPYPERLPKYFDGTHLIRSRSPNYRVRRLEMVQVADAAI